MANVSLFSLYSKCFIYGINVSICEIVIVGGVLRITDPTNARQFGR